MRGVVWWVGLALASLGCGNSESATKGNGGRSSQGGSSAAGGSGTGGTVTGGSGTGGASGAGATGGGSGTPGTGGGSGAGAGGASSGGAAGSGGAGGAPMGGVPNPPNALVLGPYELSGGPTRRGSDWRGEFGFWTPAVQVLESGSTWFVAHGELAAFELMPVTTGLTRFPEAAGLGRDWLCPGSGSTFSLMTVIDDDFRCGSATRCDYKLVQTNGSWLRCPAGSTGTLEFSPAVQAQLSTLTSTVPELDGLVLQLLTAPNVFPDPNFVPVPDENSYFGEANDDNMRLIYQSEPVVPPQGELTTEWTMSNIAVLYRRGAFTGTTQLVCASGGTYRVTDTEPFAHSIELTGVTLMTCPGEPQTQPIVMDAFEN